MKEDDIADKNRHAASSTLYKEGRNAMSRLVKKDGSFVLHSLHGLQQFRRGHELGIGEDPSGKVRFFMAGALYNVRRD